MSNGAHHRRGFELLANAANAFRLRDWTVTQIDRDGLRYVANIQAWLHWALGVLVAVLVYRLTQTYTLPSHSSKMVLSTVHVGGPS